MDTFQVGRFAVRRETAVVAGLFIFGLVVGLILARVLVREPRVASVDYAVLVAKIHERERNVPLAVERLQAVGIAKPAEAVAAMARDHPTTTAEAAQDAQSLRELARALGQPVAEAGPVAQSAQPIWLLTLLVFLLALGLGSLFAFRILGVRLPRLDRRLAARRYSANWRTRPATPDAAAPRHQPTQPPVVLRNPILAARAAASQPPRPVAQGTGAQAEMAAGARTATAELPRSQLSFRSGYRFGDEPYDEIHPIFDRRARALVGACGVSAARQIPGPGPTRYWAFTAWVHDYVSSQQQLKAVGLVSKWAYHNFGDEIDEWLRSGEIDELRQVDSGGCSRLETSNLGANLTVEEFEYGDGVPPEGYFTRLVAQFDVDLSPAADTQRRES